MKDMNQYPFSLLIGCVTIAMIDHCGIHSQLVFMADIHVGSGIELKLEIQMASVLRRNQRPVREMTLTKVKMNQKR